MALRSIHTHSLGNEDPVPESSSSTETTPVLKVETTPATAPMYTPDAGRISSPGQNSVGKSAKLDPHWNSSQGFNAAETAPAIIAGSGFFTHRQNLESSEMAPGTPPPGLKQPSASLFDQKPEMSRLNRFTGSNSNPADDPSHEDDENPPPGVAFARGATLSKCQTMPVRPRRFTLSGDAPPALAAVHEMHAAEDLPADDVWPSAVPAARKPACRRRSSLSGSSSFPVLRNDDDALPVLEDDPFRLEDDPPPANQPMKPRFLRCQSMQLMRSRFPPVTDYHPVVEEVREECRAEAVPVEDSWPHGPAPLCLRPPKPRRSSLSGCVVSDSPTGVQTPPLPCLEPPPFHSHANAPAHESFAEDDEDPSLRLRGSDGRTASFTRSSSMPLRGRRATYSGEAHAAVEAIKEECRSQKDPDLDMWPASAPPALKATRHRRSSFGGDSLGSPDASHGSSFALPTLISGELYDLFNERPSVEEQAIASSGRGSFSRPFGMPGGQAEPFSPSAQRDAVCDSMHWAGTWSNQPAPVLTRRRSTVSEPTGSPVETRSPASATARLQPEDPFKEDSDPISLYNSGAQRFLRSQTMPLRGRRATISGELHSAVEVVKEVVRTEQAAPEEDTWPTEAHAMARQRSTRRRSSLGGEATDDSWWPVPPSGGQAHGNPGISEGQVLCSAHNSAPSFSAAGRSVSWRRRRASASGDLHPELEVVKEVVRAEQAALEEDPWPTEAPAMARQRSTRRRSSLGGEATDDSLWPLPPSGVRAHGNPAMSEGQLFCSAQNSAPSFSASGRSMSWRRRRASASGDLHSELEVVKEVVRAEQAAPEEDTWPTVAPAMARQRSTRRRSSLGGEANDDSLWPLPPTGGQVHGNPGISEEKLFCSPNGGSRGPPAHTPSLAASGSLSWSLRRASASGESSGSISSISEA